MLSYVIFEDTNLIDQSGSSTLELSSLIEMVKSPMTILKNPATHIHRNIASSNYEVYTWESHQRIILDNNLKINTAGTITEHSTLYWSIILENMQKVRDNVVSSIGNVTSIKIPVLSFIGYYGYFSFELSRLLENYNQRDDRVSRPYLVLDFPTKLLVKSGNYTYYLELNLETLPTDSTVSRNLRSTDLVDGCIYHDTDYSDYIQDLQEIIRHIKQGDIYQANYTQQFRLKVSDNLDMTDLYRGILSTNSLPHAAYLNYSDFQVMSISPELFLQIEDGNVITKPIKGTRPRGRDQEEDKLFIHELINSSKDQAELAMIVDLLRNDLGKSALSGSVEVKAHATIETYENVHHLVSTVSAKIQKDLASTWRLLLRALPGGSISGVPKLRSLEIIEAHEKVTRDVYTGNIGFIGLQGDLELNIAIRTVILDSLPDSSRMATFNAGGGIVFDSDPVEEYIESLHKAKHIAKYLGHTFIGDIIYLDGQFELSHQTLLQPSILGIFETILVKNGKIQLPTYHLDRLKHGIDTLGIEVDPITEENLEMFLRLNLVTTGMMRLNIYAWIDDGEGHCMVKVQPYTPPTSNISLLITPDNSFEVPDTVKSGLKSLEYESYRRKTQKAMTLDCWDQLLIDRNGDLLEGGRCTVYFNIDNCWYTPRDNVVKGVIRQVLIDNQLVTTRQVTVEQLSKVKAIAVSNALIGLVEVQKIIETDGSVFWENSTGHVRFSELREALAKYIDLS